MRTAIVTGSSSGIGEALSLDLARWGWRVFGFDLTAGDSPMTSSDLAGFGGSVEPMVVDRSQERRVGKEGRSRGSPHP